MHAWKNQKIVENFLTNTRKAIPFGGEQLDIILRLIGKSQINVNRYIDLGCGDGILANTLLTQYPNAQGLLIDYSPAMVDAAKKRMNCFENQTILQDDLTNSNWKKHVIEKVDVVLSGFAIHHLKNGRKYDLFEEIYDVLKPGGIFINLEHVKSESLFGNSLFNELMVDTLYAKLKDEGKEKNKVQLMEEHLKRPDQYDNILISVGIQCDWLKEIGFKDVDCFFKCFELAIYGGIKAI
jgi:tRNA (cmo5U34)-methyltransferase